MGLEKTVIGQVELIKEQSKRIAMLERDNLALHRENEELKARLRACENAHTPPSLSKKKRPPKQGNGKLGAPRGHPRVFGETIWREHYKPRHTQDNQ